MAKTIAPLLSFGAGGAIAKTQVYASWRGIPYARRYVVPANPKSADQMLTRNTFAWLTKAWKVLNGNIQAPWTLFATGKPLTNRNAWISANLTVLRDSTSIAGIVASPGAGGGIVADSIAASASGTTVTVTLGEPTLPTGWSITGGYALAVVDQDPSSSTDYTTTAGASTTTPFNPTVTVPATGTYEISAFYKFQKADGTVAYGPSMNTSVVVS